MRKVSKKFLSDSPSENGSIVWTVVTPKNDSRRDPSNTTIEADIQFRACYGEPVEISFYTSTSSARKKRLKKIDVLINELQKFKEAYLVAIEDVEKLEKKGKKS